MADICLDCARRLGLPEADIAADPGTPVWNFCEGCGPGWFDKHGKRVTDEKTAAPDVDFSKVGIWDNRFRLTHVAHLDVNS
jgi:hypothetical protein